MKFISQHLFTQFNLTFHDSQKYGKLPGNLPSPSHRASMLFKD